MFREDILLEALPNNISVKSLITVHRLGNILIVDINKSANIETSSKRVGGSEVTTTF